MWFSTETARYASTALFAFVLSAAPGFALAEGERTAAVAAHARHLPFEGAANFRDLGGYTAAEGKRVRWGRLYRSDALDSLTPADMKRLAGLKVAKITDFRSPGEIAKRPDRLTAQLEARRVPVPLDDPLPNAADAEFLQALELTNEEEKLARIDRLVATHYYPRIARDGQAAYSRWLHSLLDAPNDSAHVFHCTGGADRTGIAAALLLSVLGVTKDQILGDYLLSNNYVFSARGRALFESKGVTAMPAAYRLHARYLEAAFTVMESEYGSIDNYLREGLGIDDEVKRRLRARYLE
jgi:protein-tyrosine phosphatase